MLFRHIELENILSFKTCLLDLQPLNVLIGANATGKSNLIRVFDLVRSLPKDLASKLSQGEGPRAWINRRTNGPAKLTLLGADSRVPFYSLAFRETQQSYQILSESGQDFDRSEDQIELLGEKKTFPARSSHQSVLSSFRTAGALIDKMASGIEEIRVYPEFKTGPNTTARLGVSSSSLGHFLWDDGSNLALVLNELFLHGHRNDVNKCLNRLFPLFEEVIPLTRNGITQLYVREEGIEVPFSAASLSDGTLRLLCLLAILFDPEPPTLLCIEGPEIGLHPDALRMIAELLIDASARTQLIVTTHSPALIDALASKPECIVVCERDFDGFTTMQRLQPDRLVEWLEDYSLGDLWTRGEIGGTRW